MKFKAILLIFAQLHGVKCARSALEQLDTLVMHTKKWMTFHLNATWDQGGLDLSNFQPGRVERILAKAGLQNDDAIISEYPHGDALCSHLMINMIP